MSQYHILNGDALKEQFPKIDGTIIVLRECLIMGDVKGASLPQFFQNRFTVLHNTYGVTKEEFENKVERELLKITQIPKTASVNLWFERDLFCQVNLWFAIHQLSTSTAVKNYFLVLPTSSLQFGFGGMDKASLKEAYQQKQFLSKEQVIAFHQLWLCYQESNFKKMMEIAKEYKESLPFVLPAVQAHLARQPNQEGLGHPELLLLSLKKELQTDHFPTLFKEFSKRAPIYGFGDSQVKQILDRMKD